MYAAAVLQDITSLKCWSITAELTPVALA